MAENIFTLYLGVLDFTFIFAESVEQYRLAQRAVRSCSALTAAVSLSHNNSCFQRNIAITKFLVSQTCKIRFDAQSTVTMYTCAKIPKHG